jgi:uncharacterized membrane protein
MNPAFVKTMPVGTDRSAGWGRSIDRGIFALFVAQLVFVCVLTWLPASRFAAARWPEGILLCLATAAAVSSMLKQLPGQNVILAGLIIIFIGGAIQTVGALTGIPFGPFAYTGNFGQTLFNPLPWCAPLLWLVAIPVNRGVARLVLRPWRKTQAYGFWLIGITTALIVLLDFDLEPFATQVKHYWLWQPTRLPLDWYGAPLVNPLGWAVTALLILAFATPALIVKKPGPRQPPDYQPLAFWLLITVLFASGAVAHRLWPAAVFIAVSSAVVAIFAIRGGRW